MPGYVDLSTARTWYDTLGEGDPLVLMHPGMVDSRAFGPNLDALAARFQAFTPERRAHGHTRDVDGPITYELMAHDTIEFLESVVGGPAHLVGYSDGAVVALLVAVRRPDLARRLVVVSGVFHRDGWLPGVLDAGEAPPDFMADMYAEVSPDGRDHFPVVAAKIAAAHAEGPTLTEAELAGVTCRTLVMAGDDDEMSLEHLIALYRGISDAELAIVPGTSHGLLAEKPALCNAMIVDFLSTDPVPTMAPIRRR